MGGIFFTKVVALSFGWGSSGVPTGALRILLFLLFFKRGPLYGRGPGHCRRRLVAVESLAWPLRSHIPPLPLFAVPSPLLTVPSGRDGDRNAEELAVKRLGAVLMHVCHQGTGQCEEELAGRRKERSAA